MGRIERIVAQAGRGLSVLAGVAVACRVGQRMDSGDRRKCGCCTKANELDWHLSLHRVVNMRYTIV